MINVRGIANAAIQAVNPNILVPWLRSTGNTNNRGVLTPTFVSTTVQAQIQAATADQLKHIENLNSEDVYRNVRIYGNAQGVVRVDAKGGDLFQFPQAPGGDVRTWKVVKVLETWPTWCSVLAVLQTDPVPV